MNCFDKFKGTWQTKYRNDMMTGDDVVDIQCAEGVGAEDETYSNYRMV
jgi:hypothetical protein